MLGKYESTIKYGQTRNTGNIGNKTNYLRIQISFKYWTLLSLECNNKTKQNKTKHTKKRTETKKNKNENNKRKTNKNQRKKREKNKTENQKTRYDIIRKTFIKSCYWSNPSNFNLVQLLSVHNIKKLNNLRKCQFFLNFFF
jgi:hypothetical protein